MVESKRALWGLFYKNTIPFRMVYIHGLITSQRPYLLIPSHWWLKSVCCDVKKCLLWYYPAFFLLLRLIHFNLYVKWRYNHCVCEREGGGGGERERRERHSLVWSKENAQRFKWILNTLGFKFCSYYLLFNNRKTHCFESVHSKIYVMLAT